MFRKLTTEFRNTARRWSARPLRAASLGILLTLLIVSGPLACVVHCEITGETHAAHHHGQHVHASAAPAASSQISTHRLMLINAQGDHMLCDYVMSSSVDAAPSALTVGVMLLLSLTPRIAVVAFRRMDLKPQIRLLALPPPPDPPRFAPGLA